MRELDTRAQVVMKNIDQKANEYMKAIINAEDITDESKKENLRMIQELFNKAKEFGDDKVDVLIMIIWFVLLHH